jgi:hypothetical protein
MNEGTSILDYASPRAQGKLRLPARSRLTVNVRERERAVRIVETLTGQRGAVAGIAFACFVLIVMISESLAMRRQDRAVAGLFAVVGAVEIALIVAIIRETWRTTTVEAGSERLRILFQVPLSRLTIHECEAGLVVLVDVVQLPARGPIAQEAHIELTITDHPRVVLFAGHDINELAWIALVLRWALRMNAPDGTRV